MLANGLIVVRNAIYHFVDTKMTFEQIYSVRLFHSLLRSFSFFDIFFCCCRCFFSLTIINIMHSFSNKFNRAAMLCGDITERFFLYLIQYIRNVPLKVCSARYFEEKKWIIAVSDKNSIDTKTKLLWQQRFFSACNANVLFCKNASNHTHFKYTKVPFLDYEIQIKCNSFALKFLIKHFIFSMHHTFK